MQVYLHLFSVLPNKMRLQNKATYKACSRRQEGNMSKHTQVTPDKESMSVNENLEHASNVDPTERDDCSFTYSSTCLFCSF